MVSFSRYQMMLCSVEKKMYTIYSHRPLHQVHLFNPMQQLYIFSDCADIGGVLGIRYILIILDSVPNILSTPLTYMREVKYLATLFNLMHPTIPPSPQQNYHIFVTCSLQFLLLCFNSCLVLSEITLDIFKPWFSVLSLFDSVLVCVFDSCTVQACFCATYLK